MFGGTVEDITELGDAYQIITNKGIDFLYNSKNDDAKIVAKGKQYPTGKIKLDSTDIDTLINFCREKNPNTNIDLSSFNIK